MNKESLQKYPITFTNYMCDICSKENNLKDRIHKIIIGEGIHEYKYNEYNKRFYELWKQYYVPVVNINGILICSRHLVELKDFLND